MEITSPANPLIKQICTLHSAKGRKKHQQCIAEGIRTLSTVIGAGWQPEHVLATHALLETAQKTFPNIPIILVANAVMNKISTASTPSGLLGVFQIPANPQPTLLSSGIVLAGIADPGNMGTLLRTCAAFDKKSVVIIEGCDPYSPKVIQSSAGTIATLDIFQWSWNELIEHKGSVQLIALVPHGGQIPYKLEIPEGLIVIGSEAHGIKPEWLQSCEHHLTIPMPGGTESLNAAVAGAIAMHSIWFNNN